MLKKNASYLGFDFGTKKIGVAIGQSLTRTATPLARLKAKQGTPDWQQIAHLIKEWQPVGLIVGIPLNMDGTEQAMTQKVKKFVQHLKTRFQLPVYTIDEQLTTVAARSELFEAGGYKALVNTEVDSVAAQILLESWLRENPLTNASSE
jgi:putative Holliday junction resolvase